MEGWLEVIAKNLTLIVDAMALLIISIGTIEAFFAGIRVLLISSATNEERRMVWVRYARWLIAGLTFQLAADIIGTSVAPNWTASGDSVQSPSSGLSSTSSLSVSSPRLRTSNFFFPKRDCRWIVNDSA
jgi:uncharacterized membrane protein